MSRRDSTKIKKIFLGISIGLFAFVEFFGLLLVPQPVHAAGLPVASTEIESIPAKTDNVLEEIGEALLSAALGAVIQGASYFMRKLAYDTATYIASGGKGQGALAFQEGVGPYFVNTLVDAGAEAIDQLGEGFGINLCKPPDIGFTMGLKVGLSRTYGAGGGPQPNCSWQELSSAWEEGVDNDFGLASAANFADSLSVGQSDFGFALGAMAQISELRATAQITAEVERLVGNGFKPVTDFISGNIKTPAKIVADEAESLTGKRQGRLSLDQMGAVYGAGLKQILPMTASVFLNTLVSGLLDQVLSEGILPSVNEVDVFDFFASTFVNNRKAVQKAFNFLFTAVPTKSETIFDVVAEFSACPDSPGLNNCVMGADFRQIIQRSQIGDFMTVGQALEEGLLHADWPLISPRREADNTDITGCYINKYCYSNLQKMRKTRILPLGFEIAALQSDPDQPWTLGDVVAGFDDCTLNAVGDVLPDPKKPFCHLIDPNWIIRSPEARCEARVIGPELLAPSVPQRREECVDISTCITEGSNGECVDNYYSYCTKEKNVWRFGNTVSMCEEQYATCKTYTKGSGELASYLTRTLDFSECRADNIGCRAYSLEQTGDDWVSSATEDPDFKFAKAGRNKSIYFSDNINLKGANCPAGADGCSAFYTLSENEDGTYTSTDNLTHLKKAPAYLGCYDTKPDTLEIDWPTTKQSIINDLSSDESCDAFAQVCVEEEIGCQGYTPTVGGGPEVPGIVGNNACDASCVGYDAFQQEASTFEPLDYPLYFIPAVAEASMLGGGEICTEQYAGCDEFTNLDTLAAGGESTEYYTKIKYCEKPDIQNGETVNLKTFYSWEGSASEGFVLRVHKLRPVLADSDNNDVAYLGALNMVFLDGDSVDTVFPEGSPMYADDSAGQLQDYYDTCNETAYAESIADPGANVSVPDCRAFYDTSNNVHYRLLSKTITVSDACHPIRKTESLLFEDVALAGNVGLCEQKGGLYEGGSCQRCYGGGRYESGGDASGSCVYNAMTGENESLSCPEVAAGCRAYTGNAGSNIFIVFIDNFEPVDSTDEDALNEAKSGWSDAANIVSESTIVSQYSLLIDQTIAERTIEAGDLDADAWYEVTFWARGVSQNVRVSIQQDGESWEFTKDKLTGGDALVGIGDSWQQYSIGPVQFGGDSEAEASLVFERTLFSGNTGPYFIDNVQLDRVIDHVYLIKDSWKQLVQYGDEFVLADAPIVCDANPTDAFPGIALGCQAYVDRVGTTVNTIGFETLCREEAIGCTPLIDTFNTIDTDEEEDMHAFNVACTLPGGNIVTAATTCTIGENEDWACTVLPGKNSCYVDEVVATDVIELEALPNASIDEATVIVPADTSIDNPIFLTDTPQYQCGGQYRGCMKVGLEEQVLPDEDTVSYSHNDRYVLNNPDNYAGDGGILCRPDLVGCEKFQSGNITSYFKDPKLVGGKFCEYKEDVDIEGGTFSGWFITGVGECSDTGSLCRSGSDCTTPATCNNVGEVACYPDYFIDSGKYGLWSNGTQKYDGFVGTCPIGQNACTALVDPADSTDINPDGQPYYVIFDDDVTRRVGECEGEASLEEGCVLFDKTDSPNKVYDSALTYAASETAIKNNQSSLVSPISSIANDSNIILNVDRDRQCSEWLACKTSLSQTNDRGGKDDLCYEYRACDGVSSGKCDSWIPRDNATDTFLSRDAYITRDTSWYGEEYTGFSLFNQYSINNLIYITIAPEEESDDDAQSYMAYKVPPTFFDNAEDGEEVDCAVGNTFEEDWEVCGFDGGGRCFDGDCVYPTDGSFREQANADNISVVTEDLGSAGLCKAFPEADSPFPREIVKDPSSLGGDIDSRVDFIEKKPLFDGANVCQDGNCSCEYQKVEYENGVTDYWSQSILNNKGSQLPQPGICVGGDKDGESCKEDSFCSPGTCSLISKKETHLGLYGYCLEFDKSRPINGNEDEFACLTWLPIDVSASGKDNYNFDISAGFNKKDDSVKDQEGVYCVDATSIEGVADLEKLTDDVNADFIRQGFKKMLGWENCFVFTMLNGPSAYCADVDKNAGFGGNTLFNFYTIMHYWVTGPDSFAFSETVSRDEFDENLIVLRTEQSMTTLEKIGDFSAVKTTYEDGDNNPNAVPRRTNLIMPYNFLPRVRVFGVPKGDLCGDACGDITYTYHSAGTVMHPPRQWVDKEYLGEPAGAGDNLQNYALYKPSDDIKANSDWSVSGLAMAPGPYYSIENMDSALYRSPFEAAMNVADLDRVFFVPTAYPGGQQDQNPLWLDDDIYIDFTKLNNSDGPDDHGESLSIYNKTADEDLFDDEDDCFDEIPFVNPTCGTNLGAKVMTYLIKNSDNSALISQYSKLKPYNPNTNNPEAKSDSARNRIDKRYVLLWYEGSKTSLVSLDWIKGLEDFDPLTPELADPFSDDVDCDIAIDSKWFAIAMDFNPNGEFLGYVSRWCSGMNGDDDGIGNEDDISENGVNMTVVAKLNNSCTEYHLAYERDGIDDKAWTNRVWENSQHSVLDLPISKKIDSPFRPYAGTGLSGSALAIGNDVELRGYLMPNDGFLEVEPDVFVIEPDMYPLGRPFSCYSSVLEGFSGVWDFDVLDGNSDNDDGDGTCGGIQGIKTFKQIFAKSFKIVKRKDGWSGDNTDWIGDIVEDEDYADEVGQDLLPPQIYSLNPATCFGEGACSAGESNNITVNARNGTTKDYDGDGVPDEDPDDSGNPDVHIAKGGFAAVVQFFAFADDNRMPITRVMVEWGDESQATNQGRDGMYKNRKPFCDSSDSGGAPDVGYCGLNSTSAPSLLTCRDNSDCPVDSGQICIGGESGNPLPSGIITGSEDRDSFDIARFGNSPRACTEEFFEFQHGYFCEAESSARVEVGVARGAGLISEEDELRLLAQGVGLNDEVCVFKPKVQVKDNWGWCNGSCNGPGNTGCYSETVEVNENGDEKIVDYCSAQKSNPWIQYAGTIIVIP